MVKFIVYLYSLIVFLNTCCGRTYISDPNVGVEYLLANEPMRLRCVQEEGEDLEWYRGSTQIKDDDTSLGFYIATSVDKGMQISTLHKKEHTNRNDTSRYHCQPVSRPSDAFYIDVVVFDIIGTNYVMKKTFEDVKLSCTIGGLPSAVTVQSVSWIRDGITVANLERQYKIEVHESKLNTILNIYSVQQHLVGNYTCVFVLSSTLGAKNATLLIETIPQARFPERSVNLVEDENLIAQCLVWGIPRPTVTWFIQQEGAPVDERRPLVPDDRITIASDGTSLLIANVTRADRAFYWCFATNAHGVGNATVLLRIKGKYAALWPILGIIVEVIGLIVIIATYEYFRSKKRREEEAAERTERMTSLTNEHSGDGQHDETRHRKKDA